MQSADATLPPAADAARAEVVRRLSLRADPGAPDQGAAELLATWVLDTPVGGRGRVGRSHDTSGSVPDRELLRVCLAVLARFCEEEPADQDPPSGPRRRPWRRRPRRVPLRVVGPSPEAERWRRTLATGGAPRPDDPVVVVAGPLDDLALGLWRERVEAGSGVRWRRLWDGFAARDRLPLALDPAATVRRWAERVGADRVAVLVPSAAGIGHDDLVPLLPAGSRGLPDRPAGTRVDATDTDLLRRLNQLLASRPEAVRRRPYEGVLAARFEHVGETPGVPGPVLDWVRERARGLADALEGVGREVRVVGDPAALVPAADAGEDDRPRGVPAGAALDRALDVLAGQFRGGDPWRAR